jgi:hypothetical protein
MKRTSVVLDQTWDTPRDCLYCRSEFTPKRAQDKKQRFCKQDCRREYFKYGTKNKTRAAIRADLQREIDALKNRVDALEMKLTVTVVSA